MFVVSACLIGLRTRYDEQSATSEEIAELARKGEAIPLCPEQLGGMPTPRSPCTLVGGDGLDLLEGRAKAVNSDGEEVTENLIRGAEEVLRVVKLVKALRVYLKEGSPSCGVGQTDCDWKGKKGSGVTAALLRREGVEVIGVP